MKIFLFKCIEKEYVDGALVVAASDFEAAQKVVKNDNGKSHYITERAKLIRNKKEVESDEYYSYVFLLKHVFDVGDYVKEGIMLSAYHSG